MATLCEGQSVGIDNKRIEDGDKIPKNPKRIVWVAEERSVSGVHLDRFEFEFSGGNVTVDEFRLGNTFNSVTTSLKN